MIGIKVRKALIRLILGTIPEATTGIVKSVDEGDFTCVVTPSDGGPDYENVRLKVSINDDDNGLVTIPDVNSLVIMSPLFNNEHAYYISRFSKVKKWILKTVSGRFILLDNEGKIKINGDQYEGIPINSVILDNLNEIKTYLSTLKTATSNGINAVGVGVSASGPAGKTVFDAAMASASITFDESTNEEVLHG